MSSLFSLISHVGFWILDLAFIIAATCGLIFSLMCVFVTVARGFLDMDEGLAQLRALKTGLVVGVVLSVWLLCTSGLGSAFVFMLGLCAVLCFAALLIFLFFPGQCVYNDGDYPYPDA
jgi:hypothetical protein